MSSVRDMADIGLARLLVHVQSIKDPIEALSVLGHGSLEVLGVDGVAVVVMSDDAHRVPVFVSNDRAAQLERSQFGIGDGPCLEAFTNGHLVEAQSLSSEDRWPGLLPAATRAGIAAVFAFPLKTNSEKVGTVDFHRRSPGPLEPNQVSAGVAVASLMAGLVLASADGVAYGAVPFGWEQSGDLRLVVHQATGMVSVQTGLTVDQALARMRAQAWATDQTLDELAGAVVSRRLQFDP